MEKNLTLTGMMGVGKTTIGKRLAKKLNYCFYRHRQNYRKARG